MKNIPHQYVSKERNFVIASRHGQENKGQNMSVNIYSFKDITNTLLASLINSSTPKVPALA